MLLMTPSSSRMLDQLPESDFRPAPENCVRLSSEEATDLN
jgi:hypothetical protein